MSKKIIPFVLSGLILLLMQSFLKGERNSSPIPDDVEKVLSTSCYDCHTTGSNSKDAVKALDFKKWDQYRLTKKIGLLEDICKVIDENKMPPKKYLGYYPDKKLSVEQKELICGWTKNESEKLMEGN